MNKNRALAFVFLIIVILLGLASRKYSTFLPSILGEYPGDALWAIAVYLAWAFLMPQRSPQWLATAALASSFIVEFSQLYHAPWIDSIRGTTVGHLFLGNGFNTADLLAYTAGIAVALVFDIFVWHRRKPGKRRETDKP